jgi:biotin carboxyl carrier protein
MKMEIPVLAPEDGTIKSIIVKEGDSVVEDQTVATLEN